MHASGIALDRVVVTRPIVGIAHMQVCAVNDATDEEILAACNEQNPAGTSLGWCRVCRGNDELFGPTAPVKCFDYPDSRSHFLVSC